MRCITGTLQLVCYIIHVIKFFMEGLVFWAVPFRVGVRWVCLSSIISFIWWFILRVAQCQEEDADCPFSKRALTEELFQYWGIRSVGERSDPPTKVCHPGNDRPSFRVSYRRVRVSYDRSAIYVVKLIQRDLYGLILPEKEKRKRQVILCEIRA